MKSDIEEISELNALVEVNKRRMNKVVYRSEQALGTSRKLNKELDKLQQKAELLKETLTAIDSLYKELDQIME